MSAPTTQDSVINDSKAQPESSFWSIFNFKGLSLPNPGFVEGLHKEVRGIFPSQLLFDGGKGDFSKVLSPNFHAVHSFQLGSATTPQTYQFGAVYFNDKSFLHGMIDTNGNLQSRCNYSITQSLVAKMQAQISKQPGQSMLQLTTEYSGSDYCASLKVVNPSLIEGTGVFVADYLQSITPKLALGVETIYQIPGPGMGENMLSLVGRYQCSKAVFCASLQQMGVAQLSYHRKITDKVELGTEVQVVTASGRREALTTIGGKFDFIQGSVRAQIDSTLRVAVLVEEKLTPFLSLLISGDLDHLKGQSKFGIGLMMEQ